MHLFEMADLLLNGFLVLAQIEALPVDRFLQGCISFFPQGGHQLIECLIELHDPFIFQLLRHCIQINPDLAQTI